MNTTYDPQLVILEGPDCCGKTTLGLSLARQFRGVYLHATCTKKLVPAMADYHNSLLKIAEINIRNGFTVIIDRLWLSEKIYAQVIRPDIGAYGFDLEELCKIQEKCKRLKALTICCLSQKAKVIHAMQRDAEHPYSNDTFNAIFTAYANVFAKVDDYFGKNHPILHYDFDIEGDNLLLLGRLVRLQYNEYYNK